MEPEQPVEWELELEWAEQEWEANQAWEDNLIHSLEWAVWAECQCSLVWLLVVVHQEWAVWVAQTWIHKW